MPCFRDTEHLYRVLDAFFARLTERPEVAGPLLAGRFVLRFRYSDPAGQVTIDLREAPIRWTFGPSELEPDLEMIQSADTAHAFWLGRLSIPRAIATRRVVSRGPISQALALLPALKPAYPLYAEVLRELGELALLPGAPRPRVGTGWSQAVLRGVRDLLHRLGPPRPTPAAGRPAGSSVPLMRPGTPSSAAATTYRDPGRPAEDDALGVEMLRVMCLIRAFEQRLSVAWAAGQVPTEAIHLSIGQEATAVGVCFALRPGDLVATTHRGHGHMLAKGADLGRMMAEMLGRATGLCGGKGGSMHVTEGEIGALGANGIVGASPLIAAGAAHSARLRGTDQVAVAFLGDGATNQGMFHEAANMAAVLGLPVVFVVENNGYGEFTPLSRHTRVERLSDRAAAYGIIGETVDGNDVAAVHAAAIRAIAAARDEGRPTLLECLTYRWHGHMEGEDVDYRPAAELAAWKAKCPIDRWRTHLVGRGLMTSEGAEQLWDDAVHRVEEAFAQAQGAPEPEKAALWEDVFAPEEPVLFERPTGAPAAAEREITCSQAIREALEEELARDPSVYLLGEDVTTGGYFAVTRGLSDRFGAERIVDTPISEYAIVGSAVGAAMTGSRPVAEILFSDFLTTAADPIVNQAAKLRYMSGGQYTLPMVVRTPGGAGLGMAAQHSQSLEALFTGIPGLIVVAPATPRDAKGLLKAAIRSNNPVLFFENKLLYAATGPVPARDADEIVPLGVADIKRRGTDLTLVTVGGVLDRALEAAAELADAGIEVEVVDLRTLVPLDVEAVAASVARTGHLITVEDAPLCHGFGAEVVARVVEAVWPALRAAPRRVAALDVPIPYNSALENAAVPDAARIRDACRAALDSSSLRRGGRRLLPRLPNAQAR